MRHTIYHFGRAFLSLTLFFVIAKSSFAQISIPDEPYSFSAENLSEAIPVVEMPTIDRAALLRVDEKDEAQGLPPRFGKKMPVNLNLENSGLWETLPNGDRIWRLQIHCPEALSINLLYDDFFLPKGARLFLYNSERSQTIGAFTSINNKNDGRFATGLVYGETTILEYYEPAHLTDKGRISISEVVHGYRYIAFKEDKAFGDAGACNIDIACPEGNGWEDQKKAVALILVNGARVCTGVLVGNTTGDDRPLFVTANHCLLGGIDAMNNPNANNWSFLWRYESPSCNGSDGPTNFSTVGAFLRANSGNPGQVFKSDFAVFELVESPVEADYDVFFAGWDATGDAPLGSTGIHHPRGDVKKIAIDENIGVGTAYLSSGGEPTHWHLSEWEDGVTEPGSSGSPIFDNQNKRMVGHLSGGFAACNGEVNNNSPDWYGQTAYSWLNDGATNPARRMKDWLDPFDTGELTLDGYLPGEGGDNGGGEPGIGTCQEPLTAGCSGVYTGNNALGESNFDEYSSWGFPDHTGPEVIYRFELSVSSDITIELTGLSADLDLFLQGSCSPNSSAASSTGGGNEQIFLFNLFPGTYYIIVDGFGGATSDYTLTLDCGALPLTLTDFSGKALPVGNQLEWTTASEENTAFHVIERTADPTTGFEKIGRLKAAGFSSKALHYTFLDDQPFGKSYYRLRTVDADGKEQVSETILVERTKEPSPIVVYPIPSSSSIFIETDKIVHEMQVFNVTGQLQQQHFLPTNKNQSALELKIGDLPTGLYYLKLFTQQGQLPTQKFLVE